MPRARKYEYDGKQYDSKAELDFAKYLEVCTGSPASRTREARSLPYRVPERQRRYLPDFIDGSLVLEYKGRLDKDDRDKLLFVRETNPGIKIVLIFQRPTNKIRKGSPTSYGEWATKNGFEWYCNTIPKDHLLGLIEEYGRLG